MNIDTIKTLLTVNPVGTVGDLFLFYEGESVGGYVEAAKMTPDLVPVSCDEAALSALLQELHEVFEEEGYVGEWCLALLNKVLGFEVVPTKTWIYVIDDHGLVAPMRFDVFMDEAEA